MEKYKNAIFFAIVVAIVIIVLVLTIRSNAKSGTKEPDKSPGNEPNSLPPVKAPATAITAYKNLPTGSFPLRKGQKSKLVFLVQYTMNLLYGNDLKLDGDFGSKTQAAISNSLKTEQVSKDDAVKLFIVAGKHPQCDPAMIEAIKDINLYPVYHAN